MRLSYLDFLTPTDLPLPLDRPFVAADALDAGLSLHGLRMLVRRGLVVSPFPGIYCAAHLPEDLALRVACVKLAVPPDAVVCDRTAGWLHGAPRILAPGDHLVVPRASVFLPQTGRRLRNKITESGSRTFAPQDLVDLDGLTVTSPLRTACDLGRLLHRDQGIGALDSLLRTEAFSLDQLLAEVPRFRGMRGVTRLRELAPLADGRAESPGESTLRLRWLDCPELPAPDLQVEIHGWWGHYRVDLGVPELRFGAEYLGEEWHGPDAAVADAVRRTRLHGEAGWTLEDFRRDDVYGQKQTATVRLRHALAPLPR